MSTYGLTYLQLVNRVLGRMREAAVATVGETTYSTYITTVLNQVKSEIEQAYYWNALRDTYAIATVADGTTSYGFTGAGPEAVIIEGWNTTAQMALERGTNEQFNEWFYGTTAIQTGPSVSHYIPAGVTSNYDMKIDVWPKPNVIETLNFVIYKPQADLSDPGDIALVPQSVLIEETIARAKNERGDEDAPKPTMPGDTFIMRELLTSAVSREAGHDDYEMDWIAE